MEDLESLIWLSIVPSISTACLHVLILRALEELVNLGEELVLSDLILEALKDLINGSKVGLNLVLDVLVHAQLCLAFLQHPMKLLICPMLTVPKSPLTISCLLSFSGRVVATSWQTSRISSYLFLNQALGMLNCSISCFMARISISFSAFRQFISLRTQVMFPTLDCCSSKTCWIFSLSLSLRARASVSAALLERKLD